MLAVDIIVDKVNKINNRISPIQDEYIEKYLKEKELNLTATLNAEDAYKDAVFVIIAALTKETGQKIIAKRYANCLDKAEENEYTRNFYRRG